MTTQVPPLAFILADIPDPRQARGKRYPLAAILQVVCLSLLSGYQTVKAISEWGTNYGAQYLVGLGFKPEHGYPEFKYGGYMALLAVGLASTTFLIRDVPINEGGGRSAVYGFWGGFYFWFASISSIFRSSF